MLELRSQEAHLLRKYQFFLQQDLLEYPIADLIPKLEIIVQSLQ